MGTQQSKTQRSNARRNRAAIIQAADDAFTENAPLRSMQDVADRAGVGRATVYRHFQDRFTLAKAVADHNFTLLQEAQSGEQFDFLDIFGAVLTSSVSMRSFQELTDQMPAAEQAKLGAGLLKVLTPPLRQAQAEGRVRPEVEPHDLLVLIRMLRAGFEEAPSGADVQEYGQKLIDLLLRGLLPAR